MGAVPGREEAQRLLRGLQCLLRQGGPQDYGTAVGWGAHRARLGNIRIPACLHAHLLALGSYSVPAQTVAHAWRHTLCSAALPPTAQVSANGKTGWVWLNACAGGEATLVLDNNPECAAYCLPGELKNIGGDMAGLGTSALTARFIVR